MWRRCLLVWLSSCVLCLGSWWPAVAATSNAETAKCPPQFAACYTRAELEQIDLKLRAYERANRRIVVGSCTVGPGIGGIVTSDLHWRWLAQPIGLNCGVTFRIGRLLPKR